MAAVSTIIQVRASQIAEELRRRGISGDERVTLTIEPGGELLPGRRESRASVVAAGLTDGDIDQMVKDAQREVEPYGA